MNSRDRISTRAPAPSSLSPSAAHSRLTPPSPRARSHGAAAQAQRSPPLSPAASAPRSPRRRFQPCRRPAPPRPAFPMAITPALPTPTLPSAGRAAVRTTGPVTHRRAASARAQELKLEHGQRPPSPQGLSRVPPRTTGSAGGRGRGRGRGRGAPHSPGSRQPIPVPMLG